MFRIKNEYLLYNILKQQIYLKNFKDGEIEISLTDTVPHNFLQRIKDKAKDWTGKTWQIVVSKRDDESIRIVDIEEADLEKTKEEFKQSAEFQEIVKHFPDMEIIKVVKQSESLD